jgi:hypothetical protein
MCSRGMYELVVDSLFHSRLGYILLVVDSGFSLCHTMPVVIKATSELCGSSSTALVCGDDLLSVVGLAASWYMVLEGWERRG